jgi:hypothetical protein
MWCEAGREKQLSCIGICIRQGVKSTSNITFWFNWLLFITLILAQIDSYTLRNTSTPVSICAYNGLHGSLFMNESSLFQGLTMTPQTVFTTLSRPAQILYCHPLLLHSRPNCTQGPPLCGADSNASTLLLHVRPYFLLYLICTVINFL